MSSPFVSFCTDSGARANDGPLVGRKITSARLGKLSANSGQLCSRGKTADAGKSDSQDDWHAGRSGLACAIAGYCAKASLPTSRSLIHARVIDRATFEVPNQHPDGIKYVIVNGQISVDNGQRTPALAGRALRGPGYRR